MYPHQTERLASVLEREGFEALVAVAPENIAYVTGFHSLSQAVFRRTPLFAVYSRQSVGLVLPLIDVPAAAAAGADVDRVFPYGEFYIEDEHAPGDVAHRIREWSARPSATAADALALALEAAGVRSGVIGLDDGYLAFDAWHRAGERLAPTKVVAASSHFAQARMVKGPYELECLQRSLHVAEEAANAVIQALAPGMTEREAMRVYDEAVLDRGAVPHASMMGFGERAAIPASYASDRALRPGELVRLQVGCVHKGYHADVARTAVAGAPTPRQEAAHRAIEAGLEAAIDAIRPGVRAEQVFAAGVEAVRAHGLEGFRRHHLGHGIGLEAYEPPLLAPGEDTELEAGVVLRVAVPYYVLGWGGVHVEDTVLVVRGGAHVLNRSARGLVVLD